MADTIMRFAGIKLSHNPKELTVKRSRTVSRHKLLSGRTETGAALYEGDTVSGSGELFGENCASDLRTLERIREKNTPAPLVVPYLGAIMAVLTELSVSACQRENYAAVSFSFMAVQAKSCPEIKTKQYCTVHDECSLWDIAYENDADINELVKLNPHIRDIMQLEIGERVRLY